MRTFGHGMLLNLTLSLKYLLAFREENNKKVMI